MGAVAHHLYARGTTRRNEDKEMLLSSSRFRASNLGVLGVAALLVVSGCSSDQGDDPDSQEPPPSFLAVYEPEEPGSGDTSLIRGDLQLDEDCLYLDPESTDELRILLFPDYEVTAGEEEDSFQYLGHEYGDGDSIETGGGGSGDLAQALTNDNVTAPESCDEDTTVFWVRSQE